MRRCFLFVICVVFGYVSLSAQSIRSYDGTNNNVNNPTWGSNDINLLRMVPADYSDGISAPNGQNRPNPRTISNELFSQASLLNDPLELSNFVWVFGQFIDHDISITTNHPSEFAMIQVPMGDPQFDPFMTGTAMIPMRRNSFDPSTGVTTPRQHPNSITAFIDGSGVYGSDQNRADWLRSFQGGKLAMSSDNLLPFNTLDNEIDGQLDNSAPHMDDDVGFSPTLFVAGDSRANENLLLIAFHTLFAREHNRVCDELAAANPSLTDEQLYQKARKIVSGIIQNICYDEWLPTMGVHLPAYTGYKQSVNPGISNIFSGAAFRLGHTLLTSDITRLDNDGQEIAEGNLKLRDAFFQPHRVKDEGGLDPLFKGMAQQVQQDFDCKVIDDVRNFLFGPPGAGGMDLAAININRGRERGLPDYNTVRAAFGLDSATDWSDINSDPAFAALMENVYGNINTIDPWVGFLAEQHMPSALFGPTVMEIMTDQFLRLRDGDRFYFQNDPGLTLAERAAIASTNMADVVRRNTDITFMQGNLFKSLPHEDVANCNATSNSADLNISVRNVAGAKIQNVELSFTNGAVQDNVQYDIMSNGELSIADLPTCYDYDIELSKEGIYYGGISTFDIILIQSHLLQLNNYVIPSPYLQLAGDVDNSGSLGIGDMVAIRQLLLGHIDELPAVDAWQFYPADITFADPANPFTTQDINSNVEISLLNATQDVDFVGVKAGDVSGNATVNLQAPLEERSGDEVILQTNNQEFKKGNSLAVPVYTSDLKDLVGFQFTLDFDTDYLQFSHMQSASLSQFGKSHYNHDASLGTVVTSWTGNANLQSDTPIFYIHFDAIQSGRLADKFRMSSNVLTSEAYSSTAQISDLTLSFTGETAIAESSFEVSAPSPNPFKYNTNINVKMPVDGEAMIQITNSFGQQVYHQHALLTAGINALTIDHASLRTSGTYFYMIETAHGTKQGKLIMIQ